MKKFLFAADRAKSLADSNWDMGFFSKSIAGNDKVRWRYNVSVFFWRFLKNFEMMDFDLL